MDPQVQPKCFRHLQHMRNNWELRKRGFLIRLGHTEALLLKKKDIKWPFFPPCRNWPICAYLYCYVVECFCQINWCLHEKTSPKAPQIELVSNPARWSFSFILGHLSDILRTQKYSARTPSIVRKKGWKQVLWTMYYDRTLLFFSRPMRDKDTSALREVFQYSSLAAKPLDQLEIATHWRAF